MDLYLTAIPAQAGGSSGHERKIARVELNSESGDISTLMLEDGRRIDRDLFIDCTGFQALM